MPKEFRVVSEGAMTNFSLNLEEYISMCVLELPLSNFLNLWVLFLHNVGILFQYQKFPIKVIFVYFAIHQLPCLEHSTYESEKLF